MQPLFSFFVLGDASLVGNANRIEEEEEETSLSSQK